MRNNGFTLIELLVVIAIITVLATLLQPAVIGAIKKAKIASTQNEVASIANAARAFYTEYGRMPTTLPVGAGQDPVFGGADAPNPQAAVISILTQATNAANPRRIVFLQVSPDSMLDGNFVDPWKNPYYIVLDNNYDGSIKAELPTVGSVNLSGITVGAYSLGPTPVSVDTVIKSW